MISVGSIKTFLLSSGKVFFLKIWNQSEHDVVPGTNNSGTNYDGYDTYYGLGLGFNSDNLTFGIEYLKHDMYYDAETISASLKYNF